MSFLSSSRRLPKVKGSSLVPRGRQGSLPRAVRKDHIPKDPKGSLSSGSSSSSSSLLLGSSWGVGALSSASLAVEENIVPSCSVESIPLPVSQGCPSVGLSSVQEGGLVGGCVETPLCSSCMKLIPGC